MEDLEKRLLKVEVSVEHLEENIGMIGIFKEIIQTAKQINKYAILINIILSILIIVLLTTTNYNQRQFAKYREDSISKAELIELIQNDKI